MGIESPGDQLEETILLLERFAAVSNIRSTRFNNLELAEYQTEQAQLDLIKHFIRSMKKRNRVLNCMIPQIL